MKKKGLLIIIPVMVVILGLIGFTREGYTFYNALLGSLNFLKIEFDPLPANGFLEAARWLSVVFFCGVIYTAILALAESGLVFAKARLKDAAAIHGDSVYAQVLLSALGSKGIQSDSKLALRAPIQVILFDDDNKAIEFYQRHSSELKKAREVHICTKTACNVNMKTDNVFVTNVSEIRSIDYWRNHYCKEPETIAIIGSGSLAETVLQWALLTNVSDICGKNNYLVFGDYERFNAIHKNVDKIISEYGGDSISFCSSDWYMHIDELKKADRIILCDETMTNVRTALDMESVGIKGRIHLFAENDSAASFVGSNVSVVGAISKKNIRSVLLMDSIHRSGKFCHATYMALSGKDTENVDTVALDKLILTDAFRTEWKNMDAFTRGSNYAVAIHDPIKKELLLNAGLNVTGMTVAENMNRYDMLSNEDKDRLQEIEHIRWSRYHLLNNWEAPSGEIVIDGVKKAKDPERKLHSCLVPYCELSEEEKNKDAYYYRTLALRVN